MDKEHQFKVLRRGEERRGFRLEPVFWDLLQTLAGDRGKKLRDLIYEIVDAHPDSTNYSSKLRTIAAEALAAKLQAVEKANARTSSLVVFLSSPAPGIILGEGREIVSYNKAMVDFVQAPRGGRIRGEIASAKLSLDVPVNQIIAILVEGSGKMMECGFRLVLGDEALTGRARVCLFRDGQPGQRQLAAFII